MIAVLMIVALVATALLFATGLRLRSFVSWLLAAYVLAIAETTLLTLALSPFHAVTRAWLAAGEVALLVGALATWQLRGRPPVPAARVATSIRALLHEPVVVVFAVVVGAALAYELALVLTAPPNNWDSLTYHLARAAAWAQHGGVYWIPNAPTDRMNEFQPVAEQQELFLFVATGKGALFALPQFVAQLAIVVAILGAARRLGYGLREAVCAALLFATFTVVALEATTAQNDLVAASFAACAATLLLSGLPVEVALAGVAFGLGLGVKLIVAPVLPALALLAAIRGHRTLALFGASALGGFAVLGAWGYVLNIAETGHVLGYGRQLKQHTAGPSFPGSVSTAFRITYRFLDFSGFSASVLAGLAVAGTGVAAVLLIRRDNRQPVSSRLLPVAATAPLVLVPLLAGVMRGLAWAVHLPVNDPASTSVPFSWSLLSGPSEDQSGFGPLGVVAIAAVALVLVRAGRHGVWRHGAVSPALGLALALPVSVVVLALTAKYNPWLLRFAIVPMALTTPLLAPLFRRRAVAISIVAVASVSVALAHVRNVLKPIEGARTLPWQLSQAEAVDFSWQRGLASALVAYNRVVPVRACVGALLDQDDPAYLLYGPKLQRKIYFLGPPEEWRRARALGLRYIVIHAGDYQDPQGRLRQDGWSFRPLSTYWLLAYKPSQEASTRC
jgi:hypothetical protein